MFTSPRILLRIEGAVILAASTLLYRHEHAGWLWFVVLFLVPDLFMLGYLVNPRLGAAVYNFAHTLLTPGALFAFAFFAAKPQLFPFAIIWTAHIGLDRMFGFGLKYPSQFKDTHLQRV
jgi:hypothetical protein